MPTKSSLVVFFLLTAYLPLISQPGAPEEAVPDQLDYRWRNDDGNETDPTGATWRAAENSSITISDYNNVRLRFAVIVLATGPVFGPPYPQPTTRNVKLEYRQAGGVWTDITTSGNNHFKLALSGWFNDGDPVTDQLSSTSLEGGRMTESVSSFSFTFNWWDDLEFEYCFQPTSFVADDTYYFRMDFSGTATYLNTAQATLNIPDVTFTDGSGFSPDITRGEMNVLGRFELLSNASGPDFQSATVQLNGTRTGLSNLRLWASTDGTFDTGSDTQLGSTVSVDPGDGNSVTFNSFSESIGTSGKTFFLTADVAMEATGVVRGAIVENSSLIISNGRLTSTISNAPLSSGDASLPIELTLFSAEAIPDGVLLNWTTESEVNNLGFILERAVGANHRSAGSEDVVVWHSIASYQTHHALAGQGNTSSRTDYEFLDVTAQSAATYRYRLSDVDTKGRITILDVLEITLQETDNPDETRLNPASPNPFNPQTKIGYQLAEEASVLLSVYDIQGRLISRLIDGSRQSPGGYSVFWNGKDDFGRQAASGTYILRLIAGETVQSQKVLLMR